MTSPLHALRQLIAPTGRHRARPELLPDEPVLPGVEPTVHVVLDEAELAVLVDADQVVTTESASCPRCERTTAHAMSRDGSRRCWTCGTTTAGDQ